MIWYALLPSLILKVPNTNGEAAAITELPGLLAPLANPDILPLSFVRISTLLSYSPAGTLVRTIPVTS
jgi:hypothetical protein